MFMELPNDMFNEIFGYLSQAELVNFLLVNRKMYEKTMKYIEDKVYKNYHHSYMTRSYAKNNLIISIRHIESKMCADDYMYGLFGACSANNLDLVKYFMRIGNLRYTGKNKYKYEWRSAFEEACKNGNIKIILEFIQCNFEDWNCGYLAACRSGQLDIIDYMIRMGATRLEDGLEDGLGSACHHGQLDVVKKLLTKYNISASDFQSAFYGGHMNVIKYIHDNCNLFMDNYRWNGCLQYACKGAGNIDCINFAISNGANDWKESLSLACYSGKFDAAQMMLGKYLDKGVYNTEFLYKCVSSLCGFGSDKILELILKTIQEIDGCVNQKILIEGFNRACSACRFDVVKFLIPNYLNDLNNDFYINGLKILLRKELEKRSDVLVGYNDDVCALLLSKINFDSCGVEILNDIFSTACENKNTFVMRFIKNKGAIKCGNCKKTMKKHIN